MRTFFALIIWFACGVANAQAPAVPACFAKPFGSGTYAVTRVTTAGEWSYWWCPQTKAYPFGWELIIVAKRDGYKPVVPSLESMTIAQSLAAIWKTNVTTPCSDVSIKALCDEAKADAGAKGSPAFPKFVVAKNGTILTRPVFAYVPATSTAPASIGPVILTRRATVGAGCDCVIRGLINAGNPYCAVDAQPVNEITLCSKAP